jgi:hypothetical protein
MFTKSKLALAAIVVAVGFASPAFAQSFAFSGAETAELSAYYNGQPSYWDYAPAAHNQRPAIRKDGYRAYGLVPANQTYWPSAAALGNQR